MHWHKANWLGLTLGSCDTVHEGMMVMLSNGKWYSAWWDDGDAGDHEDDHLDVDGHDAAEQSIDVIRRQGPYNWK